LQLAEQYIVSIRFAANQYALDLVDMHLHEENPDPIDECIKLYAEDAVWDWSRTTTITRFS